MLAFRRTLFLLPVPQRLVPLLVAVAFVLGGLGMLGFASGGLLAEWRYRTDGLIVDARIVAKRTEPITRDDKPETRYIAIYRFTAENGVTAEGRYTLAAEEWERLKEGDVVAVRYLPSDPETNREAGEDEMAHWLLWMSLPLLIFTIGSAMLFFIFRAKRRIARLRRTGHRTEATLLAVEPSWLAVNGVTQVKVRYRFRDAEGRQHESSSGPMPPEETAGWKAGDVGIVYYDPKRPKDTAWTGERQPPRQNADNRPGGRAL